MYVVYFPLDSCQIHADHRSSSSLEISNKNLTCGVVELDVLGVYFHSSSQITARTLWVSPAYSLEFLLSWPYCCIIFCLRLIHINLRRIVIPIYVWVNIVIGQWLQIQIVVECLKSSDWSSVVYRCALICWFDCQQGSFHLLRDGFVRDKIFLMGFNGACPYIIEWL